MTRVPPRIATWLVERWGPRAGGESLVGDLAEEFSRGRSAFWYWCQAARAIGAGIVHDALTHRWTVVRGLAWCQLFLWAWGAFAWMVRDVGAVPLWNWTVAHEFDVVRTVLWGSGVAPVLVAQVCGATIVGWLLARSYAIAAPAVVCASAASIPVSSIAGGVWRFGLVGYFDILTAYPIRIAILAGVVAGIIVGGVLGTKVDSRLGAVRMRSDSALG